jgi:predicted nucleic-acid-binding protein
MKKVIFDTNILLRLFTEGVGPLQKKAADLIEKVEVGEITAIINELTIGECIWVLTSVYKKSKNEVIEAVKDLLMREGFEIRDKDLINQSLMVYSENNISWIDSYLYSLSKKTGIELVTFDDKLAKLCK